tara:strand:+ start:30888 stop:33041 length:2154 start_codon:yes stop_codon:yes gene_type:complete
MSKVKNSKNNKRNSDMPLMLNSNVFFSLLVLQFLNLLTLAMQFHWLYILFASIALATQFAVHVKATRQSLLNASTNQTSCYYPAPAILPTWAILLLAITGSVVIAAAGRELGLLLSMIHLLCFAYSLKMFEILNRKDLYQLVILGVFVAASSLIFMQSIYYSLAIIVLVFANFYILLSFFTAKMLLPTQVKLLCKLSLYSIPFAVVLFVGFPKLSPLWQVPNVKSAKVGLSERVKIGDIARLALSNELAFRVSFEDRSPAHAQLYWRALVLDDFDGTTWQQAEQYSTQGRQQSNDFANLSHANSAVNIELRGKGIGYQVIAEPSFQSWLFALDFATSEQANIGQRNDFALFYHGIISQTLSYQVTSYPDTILSPQLTDATRSLNLALTTQNNPKLTAKAQQLRQRYSDDAKLISRVLADFNQNNYYYTLQPPGLNNNSLDEFYFDTRAGFCEHYASAFTYLMRAAGIPARMVVGYLGGEFNPNGNYLSVYQRNAHAWTEVWLPEQGWQRIDPTAAVDPERVESGFSNNLMQEYADLSSGLFSLQPLRTMQWYKQLKMQIEAIDYHWTRWVIGYTGQKQSRVMAQLLANLKAGKNAFYLLVVLVLIVLVVSCYKLVPAKGKNQHKITQIYLQTLALMAKHDLVKEKSMTGQQFTDYIAKNCPRLLADFVVIADSFEQYSYQKFNREDSKQALNHHLSKLKYHYRRLRWQLWLAKLGIQ